MNHLCMLPPLFPALVLTSNPCQNHCAPVEFLYWDILPFLKMQCVYSQIYGPRNRLFFQTSLFLVTKFLPLWRLFCCNQFLYYLCLLSFRSSHRLISHSVFSHKAHPNSATHFCFFIPILEFHAYIQ